MFGNNRNKIPFTKKLSTDWS